jgi:hypothetical protein
MADTKHGREQKARLAEKRQRELELREALRRADEAEPLPWSDDVALDL